MSYAYPFADADEELKRAVWGKGKIDTEWDSERYRRDICGSLMEYTQHGNINSIFGWEIDHKKPTSAGGSNSLDNLQPLQWDNNRRKGDQYPWSC